MSGEHRSRLRALAIASALLVAVALLFVVRTAVRSQRAPEYCTNGCHVAEDRHRAARGHPGSKCQSCHESGVGRGLRVSLAGLVRKSGLAKHGAVSPGTCASCHEADSRWPSIAATEGHRAHPKSGELDCLSCHKSESHTDKRATDTCATCHKDARLHARDKLDEGPRPQCLNCHNFEAKPGASDAHRGVTIDGCTSCHSEGAQKTADIVPATAIHRSDLHGGVNCKLCHDPHDKVVSGGPARPCGNCHQIQLVTTNPKLPKEHFACQSCHEKHQPVAAAGSRCVKCHEQAKPKSEGLASTALRHDQCASCHVPHTWAAAPNECVNCHAREATLVRTESPAKHQRCTNCHEVHGKPPSGAVCGKCHEANAKKMLAAPAKHQDCTSCHKPHAPEARSPTACAECHKTQLHQLVSLGPASHNKAGCPTCHTLHGNPRTVNACNQCHGNHSKLVAKASRAEHQKCTSCHAQHTFAVDPKAPPCLKCHNPIAEAVLAGQANHGGKCISCHAPHGPPAVPRDKCVGCHLKIKNTPPPASVAHVRCDSCHKPHARAVGAAAQCAKCHTDKIKSGMVWASTTPHREDCKSCHSPHDVQKKAACATCHEKQATSAAGGKHVCSSCHSMHKAEAVGAQAWWGRCATCHQKQTADVAANTSHKSCAQCHKPHKFGAPECKSCHAVVMQIGLHTLKGHADCSKCHDTHRASKPVRADCMACHAKMQNHMPEAKVCTGCHTFKKY